MIEVACVVPGETILEVGPGTGILTQALVDAGAKVVAVEADADLIPALREKFGERVRIIEGDILSSLRGARPTGRERRYFGRSGVASNASDEAIFPPYRLIANIPYNITSELIQKFLTSKTPPSELILMVQREVADRITAKPGDMSLLSVACQLYAECKRLFTVPAGAFRPVPKVDSAVVSLRLRQHPALGTQDPEEVIKIAKAGFSFPRKQLHGNLANAGFGTKENIKAILEAIGLNPRIRAEELSVEQWITILSHL